MQAPIRIHFVDFWIEFYSDNFLFKLLSEHFPVVEDPKNPDVLIYSAYSGRHVNYRCKKVLYTPENLIPDYRFCDYSIGFNYDDENPKHLRYPLYLFYGDIHELIKKEPVTAEQLRHKNKFCSFIVSNGGPPERPEFFRKLSAVKHVDSAGRAFNNMPGGWTIPKGEKINFLENYRFNIAFENSASPGYLTEKIFEPFQVRTIPIYWGDPLVTNDFHPDAFVNVRDFANHEEAIRYVMELENNPDLYLEKINKPCLPGNTVPARLKEDVLLSFFEKIFYKDKISPVSQKMVFPFHAATYATRRMILKGQARFSAQVKKRLKIKI
jgi:hypothetical protein